MYTPGGLEAAGYGFSKDCKQLLNFWLSVWGRGLLLRKQTGLFFTLLGSTLAICNIKVWNPNACTASFGWP
jgi:hypothetical protein